MAPAPNEEEFMIIASALKCARSSLRSFARERKDGWTIAGPASGELVEVCRWRPRSPALRRFGCRFNWGSREIVLRGTARRQVSHHLLLRDRRRCCRLAQKECSRDYPETSNPRVAVVARRGVCRAGREHPVPDGCFERQDQRHRAGAVRVDGRALCRRRESRARRAACRVLACSFGCHVASVPTSDCCRVTACRTVPPRRDRTTGSAASLAKASWHRSGRSQNGLPAQRQHPHP